MEINNFFQEPKLYISEYEISFPDLANEYKDPSMNCRIFIFHMKNRYEVFGNKYIEVKIDEYVIKYKKDYIHIQFNNAMKYLTKELVQLK